MLGFQGLSTSSLVHRRKNKNSLSTFLLLPRYGFSIVPDETAILFLLTDLCFSVSFEIGFAIIISLLTSRTRIHTEGIRQNAVVIINRKWFRFRTAGASVSLTIQRLSLGLSHYTFLEYSGVLSL